MSIQYLTRMQPFESTRLVKVEADERIGVQVDTISLLAVAEGVHSEGFYLLRSELSQLIDDQVSEALR